MAQHVDQRCDHCGQVDNHPKSHWNDGTSYHFDCLPYDKREEFLDSNPLAPVYLDGVTSGKKGDELRAHVKAEHGENE